MAERAEMEEELKALRTQRLLRQASKYYVIAPRITMKGDDDEDQNWERGWASGLRWLKPAAVASIQRQIDEGKKRRREAWEAWAKILGALITGLVTLGSVLVSLILAWRK